MKENKRKAIWVAASPSVMGLMQENLRREFPEVVDLPACCVQEDLSMNSNDLDDEAFLQAYIEGIATVISAYINISEDPGYNRPCQSINWPSLWMTKLILNTEDLDEDEDILQETPTGLHTLSLQPKDLADNAIMQLLAPVSIGAIQAGIAYLKLSVPCDQFKDIHKEIFMTKEEAYRVLDSFRDYQRHMLRSLLSPRYSVISPNAIYC